MADALTQKDVDSLLGGAPAVDRPVPKTEVVAFDFRHPPRIARDRRANLDAIFSRFAMSVQAYMSSRLRTTTDVVLSSVEQATFAEFIFSLASPCVAAVFDITSKGHFQGVVDVGTDLGFHLIDRLFGGPGDAPPQKRPMTVLEQTVLRGVVERLLRLLDDAWKTDLPLSPSFQQFEFQPDELSVATRDENVLVANIEVRSDRFSGLITICIPLHALEGFLQEKPQRTTQAHSVSGEELVQSRHNIESRLSSANMRIVARFPAFQLRAGDIARLEVGAVIHTGHHVEVPVEVHVNGKRHFQAALGQIHRNLGVRVSNAIHDKPGKNASARFPRGRVL